MQIHRFKEIHELSLAAADWMVNHIAKSLKENDRFTLVLSGGSTPKQLHELLASERYRHKIDWRKVHIFWGDDRFVPFKDNRNNAKMAFDTLLNYVPVVPENIHIIQTENITPADSARAYEAVLKKYFEPSKTHTGKTKTFDLVLLGMGDDGHTLSLFPGLTDVIHETERWCLSLWLESQSMYRITLTHELVNRSAAIVFLVTGSGKARSLHEVLKGNYNPDFYPAQIIRPLDGELHWFVDAAAAQIL